MPPLTTSFLPKEGVPGQTQPLFHSRLPDTSSGASCQVASSSGLWNHIQALAGQKNMGSGHGSLYKQTCR